MKYLNIFNVLSSILVINFFYLQTVLNQLTKKTYFNQHLTNWACNDGRRQSPVMLQTQNSTYAENFSIVYEDYPNFNNLYVTSNLGDSSKVIEMVDFNRQNLGGYLVFELSGYQYKFDLQSIHVKYNAEHRIDGYFPDLELQFIHKKDLDYVSSANEFKKMPDVSEYLVVSVLYAINGTNSDNGFINSFSEGRFSSNRITTNASFRGVNLNMVGNGLIANRRFYYYTGSETITPCSETHMYYVVADVFQINESTVNIFRRKFEDKYAFDNFRRFNKELAELNGRRVLRNFYIDEEERKELEDGSSYLSIKYLSILAILALFLDF